jgi:hypothetical protein
VKHLLCQSPRCRKPLTSRYQTKYCCVKCYRDCTRYNRPQGFRRDYKRVPPAQEATDAR